MNVVPFLWGWSDAEGLGFLESYHHERTFLHFPRYPHPTLAKSVGDEGIVLELRILAAARMLFSKFEKSTPLLVFGMARVFLGVWHRHRVLDSCHPVSTDFLKLYSIWCSLNGREIHKPGKTQLMSLPQVSGNWHPCKLKISLWCHHSHWEGKVRNYPTKVKLFELLTSWRVITCMQTSSYHHLGRHMRLKREGESDLQTTRSCESGHHRHQNRNRVHGSPWREPHIISSRTWLSRIFSSSYIDAWHFLTVGNLEVRSYQQTMEASWPLEASLLPFSFLNVA